MSMASQSTAPNYMSIPVADSGSVEPVKTLVVAPWWRRAVDGLLCLAGTLFNIVFFTLIVVIFLVSLAANTVVCTLDLVVAPLIFGRKWLGWKHEKKIVWSALKLDYRAAQFYRDHALRFDAIEAATTDRQMTKPLRESVKAQIEAVSSMIDGGKDFIDVKDTMSLSSVVISTIFFMAYLVYFWHKGFVISDVNSKVHDALAIILPLLLQEELAAGLSQVLLWWKWSNYDNEDIWTSSDDDEDEDGAKSPKPLTEEQRLAVKAKYKKHKVAFEAHVNQQCYSVGAGAPDMTGLAAFITALWTLFFLLQGYIVESPDHHAWMAPTYWFFVAYSGFLVAFCYVPFFATSSEQQKEEFESASASCEAFLFINHMTQLQDHVVAIVTKEGTIPLSAARPAIRQLRRQAIHQMDTEDVVSYALYVLALSTYDFFSGEVNDMSLEDFRATSAGAIDQPVLPPTNHYAYYWAGCLGEAVDQGNVDDVMLSFLVQLPQEDDEAVETDGVVVGDMSEKEGNDDEGEVETDTSEDMTLFSMPVMGIHTFEDILTERNITEMTSIIDSPLVQEKKIYMLPDCDDLVCIGLEVKIMERYIVSIYIVSESGAKFGRGRVYSSANELKSMVQVAAGETPLTFVEVAEEDQMRAFASCTLDIDPTVVTKSFERRNVDDL
ncbi:Aste57867_3038 [Aphanomyces stellatus]|uniref:Aste57867_3038 protein n=1 Tax=Aphanomyces stellatus TaxID=120398 RepID=A0A485K8W2_9STRA|nr:hypothetical protein As57867_003029 [Aphanomyces stellatus]VFT80218.1 Aste57867_3038 [Aphanomyces stellatus]